MEFDKLVQYVEDHKKEHFAKVINQNKTTHWIDTYPHEVYASVLLLDNKILNWKVGETYWESPLFVYTSLDMWFDVDDLEARYTSWTVHTPEEHNRVFQELAPEWFKQWEIHEKFKGFKPY
jgi:hypothetical protein